MKLESSENAFTRWRISAVYSLLSRERVDRSKIPCMLRRPLALVLLSSAFMAFALLTATMFATLRVNWSGDKPQRLSP